MFWARISLRLTLFSLSSIVWGHVYIRYQGGFVAWNGACFSFFMPCCLLDHKSALQWHQVKTYNCVNYVRSFACLREMATVYYDFEIVALWRSTWNRHPPVRCWINSSDMKCVNFSCCFFFLMFVPDGKFDDAFCPSLCVYTPATSAQFCPNGIESVFLLHSIAL